MSPSWQVRRTLSISKGVPAVRRVRACQSCVAISRLRYGTQNLIKSIQRLILIISDGLWLTRPETPRFFTIGAEVELLTQLLVGAYRVPGVAVWTRRLRRGTRAAADRRHGPTLCPPISELSLVTIAELTLYSGCVRNRRTLSRLPQIFMSHQRRVRLRVVSMKSHAHEASAHGRTRVMAPEGMRSTAARTTGVRIASTSGAPSGSNVSSRRVRPERRCAPENAAPTCALIAARSDAAGVRPDEAASSTR